MGKSDSFPSLIDKLRNVSMLTIVVSDGDLDGGQTARTFYFVLLAFTAMTVMNGVSTLLFAQHKVIGMAIILVILLANYAAFYMAQRGHLRGAVRWFVGYSWVIITAFVFVSGAQYSPVNVLYIPVIILTVFFLERRTSLLLIGLTLSYLLGLTIAPIVGVNIPEIFPILGMGVWMVYFTSIALTIIPLVGIQTALVGALRDATQQLDERQKVETALRDSEERYRLISSMTSDYTFVDRFNAEGVGQTVLMGGAFEAITGYTHAEFVAVGGWYAVLHPDDAEQDARDTAQLHANQPVETEVRIIRKDGEIRWVRVYAYPVWDAERNQLVGINGAVRDITERKVAQRGLTENEHKFRTIFALAPFGVTLQERGGVFIDANQAFLDTVGLTADQVIGKNFLDMPTFPDKDALHQIIGDLRHNGRVQNHEMTLQRTDGVLISMLLSSQEILLSGKPVVVTVGVDISERQQAEQAVRRSEAVLRALLDANTDVAFLINRDGSLLTLNETFAAQRGESVQDSIGQNVFDMLDLELRAARMKQFEIVLATKQPARWKDPGARNGWWDNNIYPVLSPDGEVEAFAVYARNISEEKRLEAEVVRYTAQLEQMVEERTVEVRRAKEQIELILNNTSDAIALARANGDIEMSNPEFLAVFGEEASTSLERILLAVAHQDEEQMHTLVSALAKVIDDKERQHTQAQVMSVDGTTRDIDLSFIPVQTGDGTDEPGILVSAHDITHIKEIERFKAQFIADALHDMATPIAGLSMRLYMLRRAPERLEEHVRALENQVEHLRNLLADLRTLSQLDRRTLTLNLDRFDFNQIALRVFDTYEPVALNKTQTLSLSADPQLPPIQVDGSLIERVLVNLVSNAINYTPNGRSILVQTAMKSDGGGVTFSVTDDGIGIAPDDLPHIFDRFYRSDRARREQFGGTGLGLAIVKEIVELHGGTVDVESELGQGSTFTVYLPLER